MSIGKSGNGGKMARAENFLDTAIQAAKEAGSIHARYFQKDIKVKTKSSSFDLLTVADTESEKAAVALIKRRFPEHNILAEEHSYKKTPCEYTWVIDPLDGTNNFACGLPIFCASVAVADKTRVLAAAVYDVTRNELFYAKRGEGAFLNGKRIRVNAAKNLKESLLITGFYYDRGQKMIDTLEAIKRFHFASIIGIRRLGAAALDLCYVACGRAAGFWEFQLSPWDFTAGMLFIQEAGGKVTGSKGERVPLFEKYFVVASNKKIHSAMLSVINQ
jgi:myo-inositol-1(or 4)-monophosphatase